MSYKKLRDETLKESKKQKTDFRLTDTSNAENIRNLFENKIRFDHRRRRWLIWDTHRWKPDEDGSIYRYAIEAARITFQESTKIADLAQRGAIAKFAIGSENRQKLDSAISIAKTLLPITDNGNSWDSDKMLLCCPNGIIDLRSGELRNGKPEDRITMQTKVKYDPNASSPQWEKFINEIFGGNENLIHYVQKALGYSISGDMSEQIVLFCYGIGSNGKSVMFSAVSETLGDYSHSVPASTFQRNIYNNSTNDVAAIEFKRFLISAESLSSSKINEQRMKKWSGGDAETARYLYSEFFTFNPVCKIWLFVNHKPQIEDDSFGFWRRVRLIPFNKQFKGAEMDKHLAEKLKSEYEGILNWLVKGFLMWQHEGLEPTPDIISRATKDYQTENDELAEFVLDKCVEGEKYSERASVLYRAYQSWATDQGLTGADILTQAKFGRCMSDKYQKKQTNKGCMYQEITIKENSGAFPNDGFEENTEPKVVGLSNLTKPPLENMSHDGLSENGETHHFEPKQNNQPTTITLLD
ncbi:MAG: hypothetical protein ACD_72C00242G0004 [uncultured bacterium]|nr:MAG: hypothetical protein ACD_72C00242G0004 [uncultured bacterium]